MQETSYRANGSTIHYWSARGQSDLLGAAFIPRGGKAKEVYKIRSGKEEYLSDYITQDNITHISYMPIAQIKES